MTISVVKNEHFTHEVWQLVQSAIKKIFYCKKNAVGPEGKERKQSYTHFTSQGIKNWTVDMKDCTFFWTDLRNVALDQLKQNYYKILGWVLAMWKGHSAPLIYQTLYIFFFKSSLCLYFRFLIVLEVAVKHTFSTGRWVNSTSYARRLSNWKTKSE